ncbi:MAG: hypothetical protein IH860_05485 [Chloroflexi bacterium]|nr:hypothetical protein [Chloroflexota bacterium]
MKLSEADLKFLVETAATQRQDHDFIIDLVRDKEDFLEQMLDDPKLVRRILSDEEALVRISPWMLFNILLRQTRRDLETRSYINEVGQRGERIPIFEAGDVASLLDDKPPRDYLVDMMSSFARTSSSVTYRLERGRLRRRRFSDMDMDDMIHLCNRAAPEERPRYYQRIADIALFLAGIFPEQTRYGIGRRRSRFAPKRTLDDYDREGEAFYRLAARESRETGLGPVLHTLSEKFTLARRALNFLSERYMRSQMVPYFGLTE